MSRKWKPLPTHLPGWGQYREAYLAPDEIPLYRNHKKKRFNRKHKPHKPYPKPDKVLTRVAFNASASNDLRKILRISGNDLNCDCLFLRHSGKWKCVESPPELDWFPRVEVGIIKIWLERNHYEFHWLSVPKPQDAALIKCPAGEAPHKENS